MDIILTPELIKVVKEELKIEDYYEPADFVTANHILYKDFAELFPNLPKAVYYILMNDAYGMSNEIDHFGDLGRKLKLERSGKINKG